MVTTIQVQDATKQMLEKLKEMEHAESYDELINKIASEKLGTPKSMFGAVKLSAYSKKHDRMKFRGE